MSELPKSIKIGYRAVDVVKEEGRLIDSYGGYDSKDGVIVINAEYPPAEGANTLIHEILHAIWFIYGLDSVVKDKYEERVCTILANGLTQVFKDSPETMNFLSSALSGGENDQS